MENLKFIYFGGEPIGVPVLEELLQSGLTPALVVCNPDRPAGRGHKLTPPPIKTLAQQHNIPVYQPETIKTAEAIPEIADHEWDLFVVVAYNKIMPQWLIELPKHKTINVHPSLLPLRRGANPIRSAILEDDRDSIGVSIMLMDEEMDHGPILAQAAMPIADEAWPTAGSELDRALAHMGGSMLAATIPDWVAGSAAPREQDHTAATYTAKISKADGELVIDPYNMPRGEVARHAFLKIQAYQGFPGTFFFHNDTRIKINEASLQNNQELVITCVTPEGKKQQSFSDWLATLS